MDPKEFWLKKAEELKKLKKIEKALECLEQVKLIDESKNKPNFWYTQGLSYFQMEEYPNALQCYDHDLKLNKPSFETLYQKGILLYIMKKDTESIECFNKAWEIKYSSFLKTNEQINSLKKHKEFEKAIEHATNLDKMQELPSEFWHYKGLAFMELEKFSDAIECFDEGLKIENDALIFFDKAKCLLLQGNESVSIELLKRAYKIDPTIKNSIQNEPLFGDINKRAQIINWSLE